MLKRELLDILCCPKCKSDLEYRAAENTLTCTRCATVYPVRNDIPILLVDAQDPDKPGSGHDDRH
jgi:uncharacterized protein YbaR (Trm112 family)